MAAASANSNVETPTKRRWYRLHLSTWVVILLLAGVFVLVEVPGEFSWGYPGTVTIDDMNRYGYRHGWPWVYLSDEYHPLDVPFNETPWLVPSAWDVFDNSSEREFSAFHLILDIFSVVAIIGTLAALFEWRRRYRSRLFQFTLRELLLLTLLTAVVFSWWRIHHNRRVREQEIARGFEAEPAFAEEYRGPRILTKLLGTNALSDFFVYVAFNGAPNTPENAERIVLLKELRDLEWIEDNQNVGNAFFTDAVIAELSSLEKLRGLSLHNTPITDSGMESIARFKKLTYLDLCGTRITSRGVKCLESLPALETLNLDYTEIDDDAAETLGRLGSLTELSLMSTALTDKSVPYLARLSRLRKLYISPKYITEKGYQELKSKLPECEISYGK